MKIESYKIQVETKGYCDIIDLTPMARDYVDQSSIMQGQATFFVSGSTAGITTVEYEPGLVQDLHEVFEKIAPQEAHYHHEETWHDGNGFSHVRASLLKPALVVPVIDGSMELGTWQQVVLIDFDNRMRQRQIVFQLMGVGERD